MSNFKVEGVQLIGGRELKFRVKKTHKLVIFQAQRGTINWIKAMCTSLIHIWKCPSNLALVIVARKDKAKFQTQ